MAYQWLFFDADGTLFNYDLAEQKALQGTFHDIGLSFSPHWTEIYRRINHQIWIDFENNRITAEALRTRRFELLFESIQFQTDIVWFSKRYLENLALASDLMQGAEETIRVLHSRFHLVVITNGLQDVQRPRLANSAINGFWYKINKSSFQLIRVEAANELTRTSNSIVKPPGTGLRST